jgi:hypothetical protein
MNVTGATTSMQSGFSENVISESLDEDLIE